MTCSLTRCPYSPDIDIIFAVLLLKPSELHI